jgi:hypothetical protein
MTSPVLGDPEGRNVTKNTFNATTWRHNPEDHDLNLHRRQNFKSSKFTENLKVQHSVITVTVRPNEDINVLNLAFMVQKTGRTGITVLHFV